MSRLTQVGLYVQRSPCTSLPVQQGTAAKQHACSGAQLHLCELLRLQQLCSMCTTNDIPNFQS
jgi:hypothetical protein